MHVLITRPLQDATSTAQALTRRGHQAIIIPLLTIEYRQSAAQDLKAVLNSPEPVQAILLTSANGVRACAALELGEDQHAVWQIPVFAVGPASAAAARAAGFETVSHAGGDSAALADLAARQCRRQAGVLLHLGGAHRAGEGALAATLQSQGFSVRHVALYHAKAAMTVPPQLARHLRAGSDQEIDAVLFYSARSAAVFRDLVMAASLSAACATLTVYCLSPAVAAALEPLVFAKVHTAAAPNGEALLALLDSR